MAEFSCSAVCLFSFTRAVAYRLFAGSLDRFLCAAVVCAAAIILEAELLSLGHLLGNPHAWLLAQLPLGVLGWIFRPAAEPARPRIRTPRAVQCIGAVYGAILVVALLTPPNTWDSLSYHLARIGYYLQHGRLDHFPTNNLRQVMYPYNAELLIMWSIVFLRVDVLAPLVQFAAACVCAGVSYGVARSLGLSRGYALLCSIVLLGTPQIALQASSTQNDLTAAAFSGCAVYFLLLFSRDGRWTTACIGGMAVGLAAGTKLTVWLFAPGLALMCLVIYMQRRALSRLWMPVAFSFAGLVFFCLPHMMRNAHATGRLVAHQPELTVRNPDLETIACNSIRYACELADFNSFPPPLSERLGNWKLAGAAWLFPDTRFLNPPRATALSAGYAFKPQPLHEDRSWFGLSGLACVCSSGAAAYFGLRRRKYHWLAYGLLPASWFFSMVLLLCWQPFNSRYFCPLMVLLMPPAIWGMQQALRPLSRRWKRAWWTALILLSLSGAFSVLVWSNNKPIIWEDMSRSILNLPRHEQRYRKRSEYTAIAAFVEAQPPSRIGFCADADQWDYVGFGSAFQHKLFRYDETIDWKKAFDEDHCDFVLVNAEWVPATWVAPLKCDVSRIFLLPPGCEAQPLAGTWHVVKRTPIRD